ncbi:hypothetical protein [Streptomyces sp. NPDC005476]|uniref:hypothetical protein n=1 Tax=Streptomyces sp. NPDC005476 TaxID=3156882 RepID=UPI003453D74E
MRIREGGERHVPGRGPRALFRNQPEYVGHDPAEPNILRYLTSVAAEQKWADSYIGGPGLSMSHRPPTAE